LREFTESSLSGKVKRKGESMPGKIVLVNKPIHEAALERLRQEVKVLTPYTASAKELLELLPQAHGIILCFGFDMGGAEMDQGKNLEVIGRHGAGLDSVDLAAASERDIPVIFTPYGPTQSTAEHVFLLMLATARRLPRLDRATRSGDFEIRERPDGMGCEMQGKALGVVGFGRIGQRVAQMCRDALNMPIYVFDPYIDPETVSAWGGTYIQNLIELAGQVDVLTVHTPLVPRTNHLMSRDVIRAMKPGGILINAARGAVVDEQALIEALRDGHLAGAGLDVYDPEPPTLDNPLFEFEQVVLTPHVASFTEEGRRRMSFTVVEDMLRVLRGERPEFLANPEVWPDHFGARQHGT
jgi:D-3-phosphoglycerate dehydrogenase